MAAGIGLRLRDEGNTDALKLLILDDAAVTNIRSTYSSTFNPINRIWNANLTSYMWQFYLPADALTPKAQEYAVPGRAKTLAGIAPRTMILCAEWDDLRDDLIIFGTRLLQAGVPTEIHVSFMRIATILSNYLTCGSHRRTVGHSTFPTSSFPMPRQVFRSWQML